MAIKSPCVEGFRFLGRRSWNIIPVRYGRYYKKGGMKPGRHFPVDWRKVDHNPAKLPWAWIPDKWKEENTIDYEREKEITKYIPEYEPKLRETEDPNYHSEPLYKFSKNTKLVEGLQQSLSLTKSVLFDKLPSSIKELEETASIPDQDDRVIQVFRHSLLFDIDPKNLDKENKIKRKKQDDFRIFSNLERYCPNILNNLIRLCQSHPSQVSNPHQRVIARDIESSAFFRRICNLNYESASDLEKNWLLSFDSAADLQILSREPLAPFADVDEVSRTIFMDLPDIFPVFPIVDLKKTHVYQPKTSSGLVKGFSHIHIHTIFIANYQNLTPDELYAQMTSQLFTCLFSRAVEEYGTTPMDLLNPLSGQAVAFDGQNYQFMCMQLNTTKLDSDDGVKNMVWIDGRQVVKTTKKTYGSLPLFESCSHRVWQNPEYYTGYDPSVFQTLLAFYLNGAL